MTPLEDGKVENGKLTFRVVPSGGLRFSFPEAGETRSGSITSLDGKIAQFDRVSLRRVGELTLADTVALLPNEGPFRSLQILKLREQIESNPQSLAAVLNEFWASVKASGAPLVEPDPSDERFQYSTFLWQGKPEHKNVLVLWHPYATNRPADFFMINLRPQTCGSELSGSHAARASSISSHQTIRLPRCLPPTESATSSRTR